MLWVFCCQPMWWSAVLLSELGFHGRKIKLNQHSTIENADQIMKQTPNRAINFSGITYYYKVVGNYTLHFLYINRFVMQDIEGSFT